MHLWDAALPLKHQIKTFSKFRAAIAEKQTSQQIGKRTAAVFPLQATETLSFLRLYPHGVFGGEFGAFLIKKKNTAIKCSEEEKNSCFIFANCFKDRRTDPRLWAHTVVSKCG